MMGGYSYRDQARRRRAEEAEIVRSFAAARERREREREARAADADVRLIEAERRRERQERSDGEGYASADGQRNVAEALAWAERLGIGFRRRAT